MKALTLTQPWATLVAIGAKHFETRDWRRSYTGLLAIHAGKGIPAELGGEEGHVQRCSEEPFASVLAAAGYTATSLPRGEVVAIANLRGCYDTNVFTAHMSAQGWSGSGRTEWRVEPALYEASFGDYGPDRYAWALDEVVDLSRSDEIFGARGRQQVWTLPDEVAERIELHLAELMA